MSFLTPLYIAGALAVVLPILFHLIRRTPRDRLPFSSLMFLSESPPRVTRRSRLEHLLLLLLRGLALTLIALAFARPFLREPVQADVGSTDGRLVALLLDTSASMRRADLWPQAMAKARLILKQTEKLDQVALFAFDREVQTLIDFDQWVETPAASRVSLALERLESLTATWASTDLGKALATVADHVDSRATRESVAQRQKQQRIVLISDLASGSELKTLREFEWPKDVRLQIEAIEPRSPTNAGIHLVVDHQELPVTEQDVVRVRVNNAADSARDQFRIRWNKSTESVEAYVPPGKNRVVTMPTPTPEDSAGELILEGDDNDFDNRVFLVLPQPRTVRVLYMGRGDAEDTKRPRYFLERALPQSRSKSIQLAVRNPDEPLLAGDLTDVGFAIVADEISPETAAALRQFLSNGGTVLAVLTSVRAGDSFRPLAAAERWTVTEAPVADYVMLEEIDFSHPLFQPMADPQYSDFTKIHFWKHRSLDLNSFSSARVLARFDDRQPAIVELPVGNGTLVLLCSGWHPEDSQLAVSTKFVPLLSGLLDRSMGQTDMSENFTIGDAVPIPEGTSWRVQKPTGKEIDLTATPRPVFTETDLPGLYSMLSQAGSRQFTVNMDPRESQTVALPVEDLEHLGVRLTSTGGLRKIESERAIMRQLLAIELEGRQKFWRWLILMALLVLIVETWLAGRLTVSRRSP